MTIRWQWFGRSLVIFGVAVGVIMPLLTVFWRGIGFLDQATVVRMAQIVVATCMQAMLSTVLAVCCAIPIAWAMMRRPGLLATSAWLAVSVPFVIPTPVAATIVTTLCAPQTWCATVLGLEVPQGLAVVLIAHVWYNSGVLVRFMVDAWQGIASRYEAAASTLGATAWRRMVTIIIPLIWPSLLAGMLLVFLYCFGSFGVVLLLGGGRVPSLEVEIWRQTSQFLRLDIAATLAIWQLCMSIVLVWVADRMQRQIPIAIQIRSLQPVSRGWGWWLACASLLVTVGLYAGPYGLLIVRAWVPNNWSHAYHLLALPVRGSGLFVSPLAAVWRSLWIAFMVAILTVCIGWGFTSGQRWWRRVAMIPLGVSGVTFGLGYILWFGPLGFLHAGWLIIMAHVVLALPLVSRQLTLARDQLGSSHVVVAATLGASPLRQWWSVTLPLLRRGFVAAGLFAFAVSLGDFAAALLLSRPDTPTAPLFLARLLSRPGATNYAMAAALAVVLIIVCVLVMVGAHLIARPRHLPK